MDTPAYANGAVVKRPVVPSWFDLVMHDLNQALMHTPPEYAGHRAAIMAVQDYYAKGTKRDDKSKKNPR